MAAWWTYFASVPTNLLYSRLYLLFWTSSKMVRNSLGTILLSFFPMFAFYISCHCVKFGWSRLQCFGGWWKWVLATMVLEVPLISSYIKGMSTSVRFPSIIVNWLELWFRLSHQGKRWFSTEFHPSGLCRFRPPWLYIGFVDSGTERLWYTSSEVVRVLHFMLFCMFWCFALSYFIFSCFVHRGRTAHTISRCRHVFARSCVCMFTCVVLSNVLILPESSLGWSNRSIFMLERSLKDQLGLKDRFCRFPTCLAGDITLIL